MSHRIGNTRCRALRNAEQRERLAQTGDIDNGLQILNPTREREIADVPVSHSAAAFIVTHEAEVIAEEVYPVAPHGTLPFVFEMGQPVCGFDQRGAGARFGPGELNAVRSAEIPNALCCPLHHRTQPRQKSHVKASEYIQTGTKLP